MPTRSSAEPSTPKRAAIQASVLRATEELLAEGATYADLNIERIATRAGISRTAFYFYFADKRELLMRLNEGLAEEFYGKADIWHSGAADPEAEIRESLGNIMRLYEEHATLLRVITEVATYDEEVAAFWRELMGRFVDATRERIEGEQRAGNAPITVAPWPTAFALCIMNERVVYEEVVQGTAIAREDLIETLVQIWMRAIYDR
ncbi:MAG: TetR/AcrR family transcriptional regulator, ethionamide resistance regulator [Solirubrobacteraceae bacterium]|jgi:AcrR family transcriptional regulator|nr:TetR/AcrR family transcriptional regulator, ethionamide resistance regulator [Solirubrobacteraceae bacterium]